MHNIPREKYFDIVSEVKKILAVFLEFCSNWLRLITLCENITLFWSCGPDCRCVLKFSQFDKIRCAPMYLHISSYMYILACVQVNFDLICNKRAGTNILRL